MCSYLCTKCISIIFKLYLKIYILILYLNTHSLHKFVSEYIRIIHLERFCWYNFIMIFVDHCHDYFLLTGTHWANSSTDRQHHVWNISWSVKKINSDLNLHLPQAEDYQFHTHLWMIHQLLTIFENS